MVTESTKAKRSTRKSATAGDSETLAKLRLICEALDEGKAQDIVVLDVRTLTLLADYFVIGTGTSSVHLQAISAGLLERGKEHGYRTRAEGNARSYWLVLDYGDTIVHLFSAEMRDFYDLEGLWSGAVTARWSPEVLS